MGDDAVRLWEEDRQRFLAIYREFLINPEVPATAKIEAVRSTNSAVRQIGALLGPTNA